MAAALVVCPLAALPTRADSVELPTPEAAKVQQSQLILAVGGRPDRLKKSIVPGRVVNDEKVLIGIAGDGGVRTVFLEQRLDVEGTGDYAIRERGPAREATPLGAEPPPLTQKGAVVWQGFTPGHRALAARLRLDPQIEASRLPFTVSVSGVADGGRIAGKGVAHVTVRNVSSQPQQLPTGSDAAAADLAGPLDKALAVARAPSSARLPSTDDVLPKELSVTAAAQQDSSQAVPLHLTGSLRVTGTTARVTGPATTPTADGASFAGTLGGSAPGTSDTSVTFDVAVDGPGTLALDLTAVAALNARELAPPRGLASWRAWAASSPTAAERKAALDLLVDVAATGARASSYSPYLGADMEGTGSTSFQVSFAPPVARRASYVGVSPRWGAIGLAGAGLVLLVGLGYAVWRRN